MGMSKLVSRSHLAVIWRIRPNLVLIALRIMVQSNPDTQWKCRFTFSLLVSYQHQGIAQSLKRTKEKGLILKPSFDDFAVESIAQSLKLTNEKGLILKASCDNLAIECYVDMDFCQILALWRWTWSHFSEVENGISNVYCKLSCDLAVQFDIRNCIIYYEGRILCPANCYEDSSFDSFEEIHVPYPYYKLYQKIWFHWWKCYL